jgi:hypothetical protein
VWPQPVTFTWGSQLAYIGNKFNIACVSSVCPAALNKSMTRYTQIVFFAGAPGSSSPSQLLGVDVSVRADAPLIMGMNESYSLSVQLPRAKIYADNQYGEHQRHSIQGLRCRLLSCAVQLLQLGLCSRTVFVQARCVRWRASRSSCPGPLT